MTYEYYTRHSLELLLVSQLFSYFPSQNFSDPLTLMLKKGSLLKGNIIDDNHCLQLTDQRMSGCLSQDVWFEVIRGSSQYILLHMLGCAQLFSHAQPFVTPRAVVHQTPLTMGILQARILEWVAMPSSKDLSNPGIKPRSPTLQAYSLLPEPQGEPKNTGVDSLSLLQGNFLNPEIESGFPVLQADSLPAEMPGKPLLHNQSQIGFPKDNCKTSQPYSVFSPSLQFMQELTPSLQNIYPQSVVILVFIF